MLRKIKSLWEKQPCQSTEHNPPSHMYLENGIYEWTCTSCGAKTTFEVNRPTW